MDQTTPLPALNPTAPTRQELALSRSTRNVFLLVALKNKGAKGGIIVGTIHCFWRTYCTTIASVCHLTSSVQIRNMSTNEYDKWR